MTITDLGDLLRDNPMPWNAIPADMQAVARGALVPAAGASFDEQQRAWLDRCG